MQKQKKDYFENDYLCGGFVVIVLYCNMCYYGFLAIHAVDSDPHIRLIRVRYERRREKMF